MIDMSSDNLCNFQFDGFFFFCAEVSCLESNVAVVTGGNSGIGFETVKGLCKRGLCVIMGELKSNFMSACFQIM